MRLYLHWPTRFDYGFAAALAVGWPLMFWLVTGGPPDALNALIWSVLWPGACLLAFCVRRK